jgi:tagatose 1,6-diphosphate aldolase
VSQESLLPESGLLADGVIELRLREISPAIPAKKWVPAYHFIVVRLDSTDPVGRISLRVGASEALRLYAGQVGYTIEAPHRGNRYAARALVLVSPLAWRNGLVPLWITCDPENQASRRTCELAGAQYVETLALPPDSDMYARGERLVCRYRLDSPEKAA